jgi:endonuclease/exonuclease/phosphatase family metal-dependent hydrolase
MNMSTIQSQELQWRLGFPHAFMVNYVGLSGQLVMMWKNEISLDSKSYSKYHKDVWIIETSSMTRTLRFTSFYGELAQTYRKESWQMLRFLQKEIDLPWLCAGDFNEVLFDHEHFGVKTVMNG